MKRATITVTTSPTHVPGLTGWAWECSGARGCTHPLLESHGYAGYATEAEARAAGGAHLTRNPIPAAWDARKALA